MVLLEGSIMDDKLTNQFIFNSKRLSKILGIKDSFGNISIRKDKSIYIKSSGSKLGKLKKRDIIHLDFDAEFDIMCSKASVDTATHIELYRAFPNIKCIIHTHSIYATSWSQAVINIPCLGTTHADHWNGEIPITRKLTDKEINGDYEKETGKVIIEKIQELNVDPIQCPGILVANHGPFTWGATVEDAVKHAEQLEYIAKLTWLTLSINPNAKPISKALLNKHFARKHGSDAYYGQESD